MKIMLLDAKEFAKVEGKIFCCANYSFNMKKYVSHVWSNGWCPVTQFKVDTKGNIYGRVENELIPTEIYSNITVTTTDTVLRYKYSKAIA